MASTISFAGMASGLDTDAIVEAMVSNYKLKADNSAKQQLLLEWKQDIYKDVSKKVYNFYTGIASKLRLESTFNKKLLTASNTNAIKLDNTSTVPTGTHTLSNLTMATSAQMTTYKMGKEFDDNTTIRDLGIKADQSITITEGLGNEKKVTTIKFVDTMPINEEGDTIYLALQDKISDFQFQINNSITGAKISFDSSAQAFSISRTTGTENKIINITGDKDILQSIGLPSSEQVGEPSKLTFTLKESDTKIKGKSITSVSSSSTMGDLEIESGNTITIWDGIKNATTTIQFVDDLPKKEDRAEGTIYLISTDKISNLQAELNSHIPNLSINFDDKAGAFFIASKNTGSEQEFRIEGDTGTLRKLGFIKQDIVNTEEIKDTFSDDEKGKGEVIIAEDKSIIKFWGSDAKYTYNGIEMKSSNNNISVNGLKFSITSNTKEQITLSSATDVEGIAGTIKSFVEEYNTLISELGDLINADSAGSYEPLLDEEKEGMTDSQIEKWEKKIKDSLLRNDSTLKTIMSTMRSMLSGTLSTNSTYKSLSSIGITTSSDWSANGKLELDEDKLKEALTNNADEIIALFSANGKKESTNTNEVDTTKGLGDRIYDALGNSFKRIANVKSATSLFSDTLLTKQRATQSETTSKLEERLEKMREIYLKRFTAMETALSKLNSQTDTLTSLLSS